MIELNARKIFPIFIILLMLLPLIPVINVSATGATIISDAPYYPIYSGYSNPYNNLEHSYVTLPNGKLVVAFVSELQGIPGDIINIKVYNIDGTLYGSVNYQQSATNYFGTVGVYAVSNTVVYIYGVYEDLGTVTYIRFSVIKFNPSSLLATFITGGGISTASSGGLLGYCFVTSMVTYNGKYYFMVSVDAILPSNPSQAYVRLVEYTPDTTLTATTFYSGTGSTIKIGPINWFQSTTSLNTCYAMYSTGSGSNVNYYTVSLSAKIAVPFASLYNSIYSPGLIYGGTSITAHNIRQTRFINGDVVVNGTNQFIYFSWVGSYVDAVGQTHSYYINDRMKFNGTIIVANFQSHLGITYDSYIYDINYPTPFFVYGYELDKLNVYFYYVESLAYGTGFGVVAKVHISFTNWFDSSTYGWGYNVTYHTADNVPTQTYASYPIDYKFSSQWGLGMTYTGGVLSTVVFSGLTPTLVSYFVTLSYTPTDSPSLSTGKIYTFTATATSNSIAVIGFSFKFLVNNIQQSPAYKMTDSLGKVTYTVTFQQSGYYNLTLQLYDPTGIHRISIGDTSSYSSSGPPNLVYTLTQSYLVVMGMTPPGTKPKDDTSTYINNSLVSWISYGIDLAMVIGPVILLALMRLGPISMPVGLSVGATLGIVTGQIPIYGIFIILILIAVTAVMVFRGGFSNSGGGV